MNLNRDILECKFIKDASTPEGAKDLNRDILECKFVCRFASLSMLRAI